MCQSLEFTLHYAQLVLEHSPPLDDVRCAGVQDLVIQELVSLVLLLSVTHVGISVASVRLPAIAIALIFLVSLLALEFFKVFQGGHDAWWMCDLILGEIWELNQVVEE